MLNNTTPNNSMIHLPINQANARLMIEFQAWFAMVTVLMKANPFATGALKEIYDFFSEYGDQAVDTLQQESVGPSMSHVPSLGVAATSSEDTLLSQGASSSHQPEQTADVAVDTKVLKPIPGVPWQVKDFLSEFNGFLGKLLKEDYVSMYESMDVMVTALSVPAHGCPATSTSNASLETWSSAEAWSSAEITNITVAMRKAIEKMSSLGLAAETKQQDGLLGSFFQVTTSVQTKIKEALTWRERGFIWVKDNEQAISQYNAARGNQQTLKEALSKLLLSHMASNPYLRRYLITSLLYSVNDVECHVGDADFMPFIDALKGHPTLTSLALNYSRHIGDVGAKALAAILRDMQTLNLLDLRWDSIGGEGAKALAAALENNQTLTSLDLGGNRVSGEGAKALAAVLANHPALRSLNLMGNNFGDAGVIALAAVLENNQTLTSLDLGHNRVSGEGAKALAAALANHSTLMSLNLAYNDIGAAGARALAAALANHPTITSLNLENNNIGDEGAIALATALANHPTITSLNLENNNIGAEGAIALAAALANHPTLMSLNLAYNHIGAAGVRALAAALVNNTSLRSLSLGYNDIGDEGVIALAAALAKNQTLTSLNLGNNDIGEVGAKALADMLEHNGTLTTLTFYTDGVSLATYNRINGFLERNRANNQLDVGRSSLKDLLSVAVAEEGVDAVETTDITHTANATDARKGSGHAVSSSSAFFPPVNGLSSESSSGLACSSANATEAASSSNAQGF